MTQNTDFIKIKTGLVLKSGDTVALTKEGIPTHSPEFNQKVYDKEEEIRSKIILQINESVGLHNWAIVFGEIYPSKANYLADIYADNENICKVILDILQEQIPDIKLTPFYKGTIANYIGLNH